MDVTSGSGLSTVDVDSAVGTGGVGGGRLRSTLQTGIASTSIVYSSDRPTSSSGRMFSIQQQPPLLEPMSDTATPADDSEALEELENRLRDWMMEDGGISFAVTDGRTASQRQQQQLLQLAQRGATKPRISRLHRASTEVN